MEPSEVRIEINSFLVILFNILYILMWFAVLNLSLSKRFSRRLTYLIQGLWIILYVGVTLWLPFMSEMRLIFFLALLFALNLLCYTDSKRKIIFASEAIVAVIITNEVIGADVEDVNLRIGFFTCPGDSGKARIIPMGRPAREALEEYIYNVRKAVVEEAAERGGTR